MLLWLIGCFAPGTLPVEITAIPFDNGMQRATDGVLQTLTYEGLTCPDGEPASFFAVYREGLTEAAPIALVFHDGAFDYVTAPDLQDPTAGAHFRLQDRLSAEWARSRVFQTMGLVDGNFGGAGEDNSGALAAALLDEGVFALYPANCWGDLWHNEYGYHRNIGTEGFERNGRFMAWAAAAIASKDATEAATYRTMLGLNDLGVPVDPATVYAIGLGDGGRAPMELAFRGGNTPDFAGTLIDATPDRLDYYTANAATFSDEVTGLERIYDEEIGVVGAYSLDRYLATRGFAGTFRNRMVVYHSSADPSTPDGTIAPLLAQATARPEMIVHDTGLSLHVSINSDRQLADAAVNELLGE